jgi:elongation factor 2
MYRDELMGDSQVYPERGTVSFSAGLHGWAFTLTKFAAIYATKLGVDKNKLRPRLWGDNYYDAEAKRWTTKGTSDSGKPLTRSFCKFILEPIKAIFQATMNNESAKLEKMLTSLNIVLSSEQKQLQGKPLMKAVMQKWLPADEALLEMMCLHLPSPAKAQGYRVENLYTGPMDDPTAKAIRNCDPNGPLVIFSARWCRRRTRAASSRSAVCSPEPSRAE